VKCIFQTLKFKTTKTSRKMVAKTISKALRVGAIGGDDNGSAGCGEFEKLFTSLLKKFSEK